MQQNSLVCCGGRKVVVVVMVVVDVDTATLLKVLILHKEM
jgi:hypothetical protein